MKAKEAWDKFKNSGKIEENDKKVKSFSAQSVFS